MTELVPIPPPSAPTPALAPIDFEVSDETREHLYGAFADNTTRAYRRIGDQWFAWCARTGRSALPGTEQTLAEFTTYLADTTTERSPNGLGPSALEQAISAVSTIHKHAGFKGQPSQDMARKVIMDVRKKRAAAGERIREAPPLTVEDIQDMIDVTDPARLIGKRDRAMLILGLAAMTRRSELVALHISDLNEVDDGIEVLFRKSKTDQAARGEVVGVPRGKAEGTDPVRVVNTWVSALAEHGVTEGPLLRSVTRWNALNPAGSMSTEHVNRRVKLLAHRAGLRNADAYTAHSLRAGGLTVALRSGATLAQGARQGRWNLKSPVILRYDRAVSRWRDNPMRNIGL